MFSDHEKMLYKLSSVMIADCTIFCEMCRKWNFIVVWSMVVNIIYTLDLLGIDFVRLQIWKILECRQGNIYSGWNDGLDRAPGSNPDAEPTQAFQQYCQFHFAEK